MNDTQNEIFKAFIVALVKQTEPLPATVQSEFNKIGETLTIIDIERLAELHPPLLAAYEEADIWLVDHSNECLAGLDCVPNAESEKNNTTSNETPNNARENSDLTKLNLPEILDKMESKIEPRRFREFLGKILKAKDSVQASRDTILSSIADGLFHE